MNGILITNNPTVYKKCLDNDIDTMYLPTADFLDVLCVVRNKIHEGYKLLTHPLSGSIKPNQTPYKSIMVTNDKAQLDVESLKIIEDSIAIASKLINENKIPMWTKKILEDFQLIDFDLISRGIESMK